MPSYYYRCEENHTAEVTHSIHENPNITCEDCKGGMMRVPYTINVTFKGSGFYSKDK